jgi:hypothetical protein
MMNWTQFAQQILQDLSRMSASDEIAWTNLIEKLEHAGVEPVTQKQSKFSSKEEKIRYVLGQVLDQLKNGSYQKLTQVRQSFDGFDRK